MNLFELFVKIGVDDQASEKIKKVGDEADKASKGGLSNFVSKIGGGLKTAAKIGTVAVTAAASGITALTTSAVKNYAEYEQLVGGVQTLFGLQGQTLEEYAENVGKTTDEALDEWLKYTTGERKILNNAEKAYKTAGLSMNQYMETVTSFSASLIQSLDGDTAKAADYADMAIKDMSDNANKMGTDMSLIQTAYQGFAKQNYSMLDNLKLGYGGTAAEMYRLLQDAAKLDEEFGKTAEFSIDEKGHLTAGFADITKAINIVQKEMGIYGTTALEAEKTISGSLNSMKGAWSNLITGIADDEADFDTLINNMVETAGTFAGNLLPRIEVALGGIASLIEKLAPIIVEKIPSLVSTILPSLISASTDMVNSVIEVLPSLLETIVTALVENAPLLIEAAIGLVNSLIQSIKDNSQILIDGAISVVITLVNGILSMLPDIISLGLDLIVSLALGIANSLPTLIPTIVDTILLIVDTLTNPDMLSKILDAALILIIELAYGLMDAIPQLVDAVLDIIDNLVLFLLDPNNIAKILNASLKIVIALGTGLIKAIPRLLGSSATLIKKLVQKFKDTDWKEVGKNIIDGIKTGISNAWNNLTEWFSGLFDDLIGIAKEILGIASPSKVFKSIGLFIDEGLQGGLKQGARSIYNTVSEISDGVIDNFDAELEPDYGITTSTTSISDFGGGSYDYGYGSQNVNVTVGIDNNANAMGLARALLPFLKIAEKEVYSG